MLSPRRNAFAYRVTLQRGADYTLRAAGTRLVLLAVIGACAAVEGARPVAYVVLALALAGTTLSLLTAYYDEAGSPPRLVRWVTEQALAGKGELRANVPGLLETGAVVPLVAVAAWWMPDVDVRWRLVALAAALGYLASFVSAVFLDASFYNPHARAVRFIERVRAVCGLVAAGAAVLVAAPADWPGQFRVAAVLACGAVALVQLRLRETDRTLALSNDFAQELDLVGRAAITAPMHSTLGVDINAVHRHAKSRRETDSELYHAVVQMRATFLEVLKLDQSTQYTLDWPGILIANLQKILGGAGVQFSFDPPAAVMHPADRRLAHIVLADLATNAVAARALRCEISLTFSEGRYVASVQDDGDPVNAAAWNRDGGGHHRLDILLESRDGGITLVEAEHDKTVMACWQAHREGGRPDG